MRVTSASGSLHSNASGCFALCGLLCVLNAFTPLTSCAQEVRPSADAVKAAFLYHFVGYVEWPQGRESGPVTIGVIGSAPIAAELRQLLPGRSIAGRPVRVRVLSPGDELSGLHILFIGEHEYGRARQLIKAVQGAPTLAVTDGADGLERGAMINFIIADNRVRFEISQAAAERAGLKLSSRLLAVALRIRGAGLFFRQTPFA